VHQRILRGRQLAVLFIARSADCNNKTGKLYRRVGGRRAVEPVEEKSSDVGVKRKRKTERVVVRLTLTHVVQLTRHAYTTHHFDQLLAGLSDSRRAGVPTELAVLGHV